MLLPIDQLKDAPIMSLQTGSELARVREPIIDPRRLVIVAVYVEGPLLETNPSILHVDDIREISDIGIIIDDSDKLMSTEGLVRLQEIIDFEFKLEGVKVVDERRYHLGKVSDYAIDPGQFSVQQIYTEQSFIRSFSEATHIIHRSQIISVTNDCIVVKSPTVEKDVKKAAPVSAFINPFRPKAQHEGIRSRSAV